MSTAETRPIRAAVAPGIRPARVARLSVTTAVAGAGLAVVGGLISAVWPPTPSATPATSTCVDPPCFGDDSLPSLANLPAVAPVALIGMAAVIGALSLVLSVLPRWKGAGLVRLAAVATLGPLVVLVGGEIIPHVLSPCAPAELWGAEAPGICVETPHGFELPERWHTLDHAAVGFLPLALGLASVWRRFGARARDVTGR